MNDITDEKQNMLSELNKIPIIYLKKRLINEVKNLLIMGYCIDIFFIDDNEKLLILIFNDINSKTKYTFQINHNYPFKQPKLFINSIPYENLLSTCCSSNNIFSKLLLKITGISCLCCHSITCGNNWTPIFSLKNIILETIQYKQYVRHVINKILADKIKYKYLIKDIDLDCWLF